MSAASNVEKYRFYFGGFMLWLLTVMVACSPASSGRHYKEHEAYVEIENLVGAIRMCYSELGHFPLTNGVFVSNPKVIDMLPVLCGEENVEETKKIIQKK